MAKGDKKKQQQSTQTANQTYQSQQQPLAEQMGFNYARGSEADFGNYTDIMDRYRNLTTPGAGGTGGSSGGGGGISGYSPSHISYNDPFKSYEGYTEFSQTGGYSPNDIANMRARGVSPIRAAYANAERNVGQQRALQGGYSPNSIAAQIKMAREQGQGMADATQNVEAGLAEARNKGRLAGLGGMSNIEGQRLGADLDVGRFNATADMQAAQSAQSASMYNSQNEQQNIQNQLNALAGMRSLYGTTPGMSDTFGNQAINIVGQGGQHGLNMLGRQGEAAQMPGNYDIAMNRVGQGVDMASRMAYPWLNDEREQQPQRRQPQYNPESGYWE